MTAPNAAARAASPPDTTAQGLSPAAARAALVRLCAAGFVAYCSYAICRTPLLPLFAARDLGAGPTLVGFVMGASTLARLFVKLPAGHAIRPPRAASPAPGRSPGVREHAVHVSRVLRRSRWLVLRAVPSWQRDGNLWPRSPRRACPTSRRPRNVARGSAFTRLLKGPARRWDRSSLDP